MLLDLVVRRDSHLVAVESDPIIEGGNVVATGTIRRQPRNVVQMGDPIVLGSNILLVGVINRRPRAALSFTLSQPGSISFVPNEVPSGAIDGVNDTFSTVYSFTGLLVYLNGLRLHEGDDYDLIDSNTFSLASAPKVGDFLLVDYLR